MHFDPSWLQSPNLDTLAARVDSPLGATATLVAVRNYRLNAVVSDLPLLVVPLQGRKNVRFRDECHDCNVGNFLFVHRALRFDVENIPDPTGPYRALVLAFPWRVIELARLLYVPHACPKPTSAAELSVGKLETIQVPLRAYLEADAGEPLQTDYLALGLLLALARGGHTTFLTAHDPSLAARVRQMITEAPSRDWKSAHVELALQVSSATLRRRLRDEGTSFRSVLLDARLHAGLSLLQTTRRSVKAVASACGYSSVGSFSRAFARRFGVEPSAVMNG